VTRALERKGVQHLLEALRGVRLDHEIHIVGDGPYLGRLRKMADVTSTPVVFHGWLDNRSAALRRLYESSQIFVMTSEAENFPVALLEAMSAGLAIVTSRGTGCEEVTGDTSLLVTPGDLDELRSTMLKLAAEPERCRRLGSAARARVEREFAWSRVAARYEDLYLRHGRQVRERRTVART
jgi:glycosyltransferase involved in cell wall biosynthesis